MPLEALGIVSEINSASNWKGSMIKSWMLLMHWQAGIKRHALESQALSAPWKLTTMLQAACGQSLVLPTEGGSMIPALK
ncbi:MAG TPA: hypothetical protein VNN62_06425 [Methylomirabilota bacterium]|nr:hypothetical protein [Methylomirabilota bacterium]